MTGNLTEEDFLHVFDEMSRICGDAATTQEDACLNTIDDFRLTSAVDDDFLNNRSEYRDSGSSSSPRSRAPLVGDQLLSSTSAKITKRSLSSSDRSKRDSKEDDAAPPRKRSRNSSANSGGSVDSAIGDIYFANTPHSDLERELLELTSASCEAAAAALSGAVNKQTGHNSSIAAGSLNVDEAKYKYDEARERQAKEDEDLQFVFQDLPPPSTPHQQQQQQQQQAQQPPAAKCAEIVFQSVPPPQPLHIAPLPLPMIDGSTNWQQEIEVVCRDLLMGYRHASSLHPPQRVSLLSQSGEDPLKVTTRLLADSLVRMKIFLSSLDSVRWLTIADQNTLYNAHVCSLAILKASVGVKLELVPLAYPLPYGENLSEVEALHLILAHDLFNELRSLLAVIKNLDISDFSVMLLLVMTTFFSPPTPTGSLLQPHKVMRAHDYYVHKLQMYLLLRYGASSAPSVLSTIMTTVARVRNFSDRLREFMNDVTRCGLQKQFESVCENIGLIAFLLHSEPSLDR